MALEILAGAVNTEAIIIEADSLSEWVSLAVAAASMAQTRVEVRSTATAGLKAGAFSDQVKALSPAVYTEF